MGMNMSEKILARHAGLDHVEPGQLVVCQLDMVLANDVTGPPSIKEFEKTGRPVFDRTKIALIPDHFQPAKDIKSAELAKIMRDFARKHDILHYYEQGRVGIEHVILPERGIVGPGMLTIGADSHTCTYGAVNGFSTGVGTTDLAVGMATGEAWFKVPEAINVHLTGKKPQDISGKDVILTLIGMIGVDGALYKSLEFTGEGVASLSMTDRLTIANMAIEAGAKNGIFPYDDVCRAYVEGRMTKPFEPVAADADARYAQTVEIDLSALRPVVSFPHLPENTKRVMDIASPIAIDQVVIGSCTNGRIEDMRAAAEVLKGRTIADSVRMLVVPGSARVREQAESEGLDDIFTAAGAEWRQPGCSMCLGMNPDQLKPGERSASTSNRNFEGRQGKGGRTHLVSPHVAAATAVVGRLASPADL
mgnify:CR=1 FL=1